MTTFRSNDAIRAAFGGIILAVIVMWSVPAGAERTGGELLDRCSVYPAKSAEDEVKVRWCIGYIEGLADLVKEDKNWQLCLPDGTTVGELMDVAVAYLREHNDERKYTAPSTVLVAWQKAYPCGPKA